jgi:nicotinate-nucleotide adenylyltransferase
MKTGLLFGSFNPIHIGHIAIAGYIVEFTSIEEVWFVVSPQNPLKEPESLISEQHRLKMVGIATQSFAPRMKVCDIELSMPRPSYTIDTLTLLSNKFPEREFIPIIGADSLNCIDKWKYFDRILSNYSVYVYPRPDVDLDKLLSIYNVHTVNAPVLDISSTFIRQSVAQQKNVDFLLPKGVYEYIKSNNLYMQTK